jgi:hypothetical protein
MNLKKILAGAAISGALGFTAVGLGAGVANAEPASPAPLVTGIQLKQDWGHGGGYWGDHGGRRDWGGRRDYGYGPDYGYGRWGCISGPLGHLTWCP